MRDEKTIQKELSAQLESYRSNADKWKRSQLEESNSKVKALREELNNLYTEGAVIPESIKPYLIGGLHGMKRANGQFEVGVSVKGTKAGKEITQGLFSRGATISEAVNNWNNGKYE